MEQQLHSLEDTKRLAEKIGAALKGGEVIGLIGELGAGKTTFVRFLAEGLGSAASVSSPSFVLEHLYKIKLGTLEHWDLYRLGALPLELLEPPSQNVVRVVEWVDKFPQYLAQVDIKLSFTFGSGENSRTINYESRS